MIGPFAVGHNASWRGFQNDRPESEFVKREHAAPFGCVAEGGGGIRQHGQDTTFGSFHRGFGAQQVLSPCCTGIIDMADGVENRIRTDSGNRSSLHASWLHARNEAPMGILHLRQDFVPPVCIRRNQREWEGTFPLRFG